MLEISRSKVRTFKRKNKALKLAMKKAPDPELRSCLRKVAYDSREHAQVESQVDKGDGNGSPYKCRYCRGWHIATVKITKANG